MTIKRTFIYIIGLFVLLIWYSQPAAAMKAVKVKHEPNLISIGTFFNGTTLTVSGKIAAANEVVIILSGKLEEMTLKKKGKALGLLWMNLGDVHIKKVPNVYMLYSSKGIVELGKSNPDKWKQLGIGYQFLKNQMEIKSAPAERDNLAGEFIKLKRHQGLYNFHPGEISFGQKTGSEKSFKANVKIPSLIPTGEFRVQVLEIQNGTVTGDAIDILKVKEDGVPSMMSSLAFNHSLLYGILAVLVAFAAGLLMDFLFGTGKSGGAH